MIKAGETIDLGPLFWVSHCRSLLKSPPVVEVMEGPSDLTAAVTNQKVVAHKYSCARPVDGGELHLSASKDVKARTQGKLFLRVKYSTKDGERQIGREINYTLFPDSPATTNAQESK